MKKRRNPNPQFSVRMGRNLWHALVRAAQTGLMDREGRHAVNIVESTSESRHQPIRERTDTTFIHQIEERIAELQHAIEAIDRGTEIETVRQLLLTMSDTLRQQARAEQPRSDVDYHVSVCIERIAVNEKKTQVTSKPVATFPTSEQANAYAGLLHGIGAVLAISDPEQTRLYRWRI